MTSSTPRLNTVNSQALMVVLAKLGIAPARTELLNRLFRRVYFPDEDLQ